MNVLITGASSGIGRDLAREFNKLGYDLILVARDIEKLEKLKEDLNSKNAINTKIKIIPMDLSIEDNCKKLYAENPDIDILVNNAGFGACGNFVDIDLEKEIKMINTNITAYHILAKLYLQDMIKKDKGQILNVASIAGFMPGPLMTTYYSTKAYVVRFSEAIREELKKQKSKVKISILCPGPVNTNFNKVADVKFATKGLPSEYVAKYTVKKFLKGKFYIVPGITIKITKIFSKICPTNLMAKLCYKMQRRKII